MTTGRYFGSRTVRASGQAASTMATAAACSAENRVPAWTPFAARRGSASAQ
ncbi:hypothetical protein [Streptomyces sp. NBC_00122]|uniref:hypothetical protein n=1 Tax=Streptomyces sp. NBC_00122 TaxID=2903623 RepID=UPI003256574A